MIEKPCRASSAIHKASDTARLRPGAEVIAYGLNKRDAPSHVSITLNWKRQWLPLSCGRFVDRGPGDGKTCAPFFDAVDNPAALRTGRGDITPPAPELDEFDRAAAAFCGAPGQPVAREAFEALLRDHPAVLRRINAFSRGVVSPGDTPAEDDAAFLTKLSGLWFGAKGFEHVFCGEPSPKGAPREKIGGLHFHARYLQLQQKAQACRIENYPENELDPGAIYTMGVAMRNVNGGVSRFAVKGYGLTLSAEDLLKIGARANALRPKKPARGACLVTIRDDGHVFSAVYVWRPQGVRTFYPDATPQTDMRACGAIDLSRSSQRRP